jgi:hypothetical protein
MNSVVKRRPIVSEDGINAFPSPSQLAGECGNPRMLHAGVETWTDTCSCEPEPRWQALAEELEANARADPAALNECDRQGH